MAVLKPDQVRAALRGGDVVHVGEERLVVGVGVLEGDLDRDALSFSRVM